MATICPSLFRTGFCLNNSCQRRHDTSNFCMICNVALNTAAEYNLHINTRAHTQAETALQWLKCVLCDRYYTRGSIAQASHENSANHIKHVALRPVDSNDPPVIEVPSPPNNTRCEACNSVVASAKFVEHCRTNDHINRQRVLDYRNALIRSQTNQRGIEVSGSEDGVDLGVRSPISDSSKVTPTTLWLTCVGETPVTLTHARTSASLGVQPGFQLCFTVTTIPLPIAITPQSSVAIQIRFDPRRQRGRFEDRLEFVFRDARNDNFVITRPLKAIVGNDGLAALAPTEPYRRPRRARQREAEQQIISVERDEQPVNHSIKYKRSLVAADVPGAMEKILNQGSVEEQTNAFGSRYMPSALNFASFEQFWSNLVLAELFQARVDLSQFDMDNVNIGRIGRQYELAVPGLAEQRPSVLKGDRIKLHPHSVGDGVWFKGIVQEVRAASVLIMFHNSFPYEPSALYDVQFVLNPVPFRRMLQALKVHPKRPDVLFPRPDDMRANHDTAQPSNDHEMELYNHLLNSNAEQLQAVKKVTELPPGSPPFIIFGPPGTGKTVTIVECISQLLNDPETRILACAPSNSASDLIAQRLISIRGLQTSELFRLNAIWRPFITLPEDLLGYSLHSGGNFRVPSLDQLKSYRVIVATCSSAALLYGFGVDPGNFSHIFIDEAGQGAESEVMIPILTMSGPNTNVVLSGDPKQLGPVIRSPVARRLGMGTSYLERLMASAAYDEVVMRGISVAKLLKNFRSHESILSFPNQEFYGNELIACAPQNIANSLLQWNRLGTPNFPIIFEAVAGEDMQEGNSPSYFNPHEASLVKEYVQGLIPFVASTRNIGIVAPYKAQVRKIRKLLKDVNIGDIDIGSVEQFQGQERQVIIVSTVRSNQDMLSFDLRHTLGFVANKQRLNVAITRAQSLLVIIGDPQVLGLDNLWRRFLYFIRHSGGWKGAPFPWNPDANPDDLEVASAHAEQVLLELLRRAHPQEMETVDELGHVGTSDA